QRQVPREEHAHATCTCNLQSLPHACDDFRTIRDLAHDTDLHVVDEQGHVSRIAELLKRTWNRNAEHFLHSVLIASRPIVGEAITVNTRIRVDLHSGDRRIPTRDAVQSRRARTGEDARLRAGVVPRTTILALMMLSP